MIRREDRFLQQLIVFKIDHIHLVSTCFIAIDSASMALVNGRVVEVLGYGFRASLTITSPFEHSCLQPSGNHRFAIVEGVLGFL